jgi:hypothetical protein
MVRIRMQRVGRPKTPHFRIVAWTAERRATPPAWKCWAIITQRENQ